MVLIEKYSPERSVPLPTINEFRAVLHHVYKSIDSQESVSEIEKAKEHLFRAFYDAYSILCSCLIEKIDAIYSEYSTRVITTVSSEYYETLSAIEVLKQEVSEVRSNRETSIRSNSDFQRNWDSVNFLLDKHKKCIALIPLLEKTKNDFYEEDKKAEKKIKSRAIFDRLLYLITGLIIAAFGFYFFSDK